MRGKSLYEKIYDSESQRCLVVSRHMKINPTRLNAVNIGQSITDRSETLHNFLARLFRGSGVIILLVEQFILVNNM
jgi:hypothetical protein